MFNANFLQQDGLWKVALGKVAPSVIMTLFTPVYNGIVISAAEYVFDNEQDAMQNYCFNMTAYQETYNKTSNTGKMTLSFGKAITKGMSAVIAKQFIPEGNVLSKFIPTISGNIYDKFSAGKAPAEILEKSSFSYLKTIMKIEGSIDTSKLSTNISLNTTKKLYQYYEVPEKTISYSTDINNKIISIADESFNHSQECTSLEIKANISGKIYACNDQDCMTINIELNNQPIDTSPLCE